MRHWAVKEAVFPFDRFQNVDTLLGPEMKSTGEVMGLDLDLGLAIAKSQMAANAQLPLSGTVFISVRHPDKMAVLPVARRFQTLGYQIVATQGTAEKLREAGIECKVVNKVSQGRPHILDMIQNKEVQLIVNTSAGNRTTEDSYIIRRAALDYHILYNTTITGGLAITLALESLLRKNTGVMTIQECTKHID